MTSIRPLHEQTDPGDAHDLTLLARVHPRGWASPVATGRYHLVVIGAGTAGLVTAAGAAGLGARVALIERHLMGGDCLVTGCVPSKTLLHAARAAHAVRAALPRETAGAGGLADFGAVMQRVREVRARISVHDSAERFVALGVDVYFGDARFVARDAVDVNGRRLEFRRAVIASGSSPLVPPITGLDTCEYLTSETVFELRRQPRRMIVVGGGPIGCELGQAFARLGTAVTLVSRSERLLPRDEPDASRLLTGTLERDGVQIVTSAVVERAERNAGGCTVMVSQTGHVTRFPADAILVAAGRVPRTATLGLDRAGVDADAAGVKVNDRMQTTNRRIFAAGDVASPYKYTHAADALARLVIQNALFFGRSRASRLVIPHCTYTTPEVAQVGPTLTEARGLGLDTDTVRVPFEDVDRAIVEDETAGFLQLLLDRRSGRVMGGTIVAANAGDLSGELSTLVTAGLRISDVGRVIHPYPTTAEAFRKAADRWRRRRLTPAARRAFGVWFRLFR